MPGRAANKKQWESLKNWVTVTKKFEKIKSEFVFFFQYIIEGEWNWRPATWLGGHSVHPDVW